ncbi:hypothetical protein [Pengzhenrongella sp.]|jgi:hypothetical protein|uniref:hypothetical protein n=1 Tax=Pengzhenrongella sp. TaxID=2888820 RepID=UPI002F95A8C5
MSGVDQTDPGLRFWLSYVEHRGGLVEPVNGGALAVLPDELQVRLGLPETVSVTGDPEVAREDGALLLAAGHPVLDLSAEQVLGVGDVGQHALVWPKLELPTAEDLLEQARDTFSVDHGRIDLAAPPIRSYLPVIRAGAMIQYTVAGDEAFQERLECWLDAETRRELPDSHRKALQAALPCAPDPTQQVPFDLGPAVEAANGLLSRRAGGRLETLDGESRHARNAELDRARAYYREVLEGIERRRPNTAPERVAALDARAEATEAERARRLAEIQERHRARVNLTPYRLHLILVPAVVLPVDFLRGSRRYPQRLLWVWPAGQFRPLPCPSCGADQPLVAGKSGLGCQACMKSVTAPTRGPKAQAGPASVVSAVDSIKADSPGKPKLAVKQVKQVKPVPAVKPVARPALAETRPSVSRLRAIGNELFLAFWQAAANGDPLLVKKLLPDSPASTAERLFGVRGLKCSVGISPESTLESVSGGTRDPGPGSRFVTEGMVRTREQKAHFPAALTWRLVKGKPMIDEILPRAAFDPGSLLHRSYFGPGAVVLDRLPLRHAALDAVAARLIDVVLPVEGLPLLTRCLTAWWRLGLAPAAIGYPPRVTAAALLRLVSWRSGDRVSTADCAARLQVSVAQIKDVESDLKARLRLSADVRW